MSSSLSISSTYSSSSFSATSTSTRKVASLSNNLLNSMKPKISVDIPDIEDFHHVNTNDVPLSLTVQHDEGSSLSSLNSIKSPLLDLQNIDFLGPAEVVKKLFKLPHTREQPYFALHRMGNTLLVDSLQGIHEQEEKGKEQDDALDLAVFSPDRPINSILENMPATAAVSKFFCGFPEPQSQLAEAEDFVQQGGSPYLPPPGYFFPQHPPVMPFRNIFRWQLQDLKFALGSDLLVYNTSDRPAVTVAPIDTTKEVSLTTCLDHYLDNVMANVPELALCLHAKGFLRGISVCGTEDIPHLRSMLNSQPIGASTIENLPPKASPKYKKSGKDPLFDPQVIELNALTILRFLKQNCSDENGTYLVHLTRKDPQVSDLETPSPPDAIQIYDLQAMSLSGQRKWKWLLAMLSHRFATRLGHHYSLASPQSRVILRNRQLSLYQSCYDLLLQIHHLGGGNHGTIRAAVLEHIADIHRSRAETSHQIKRNDHNHYPVRKSEVGGSKDSKKKRSKKKQTGKSLSKLIPECDFNYQHNATGDEEYHDDELDNIDYFFEIEKSFDLFLRAMTDLGDVISSQLNEDFSETPENYSSIMIGDVSCETFEPIESFPSPKEDEKSVTPVNLMLVLQFSGLFHKAISACTSLIKNTFASTISRQGCSKLTIAINFLQKIVPYCEQWIRVTQKIKEDLRLYQAQIDSSSETETTLPNITSLSLSETLQMQQDPRIILEESIQDMWSIDRTVMEDLPLLWDTLGEVCREVMTTKPNKSDTSDLENFGMQLKDWMTSIGVIRDILLCFTKMSFQASAMTLDGITADFVFSAESQKLSLLQLISGKNWNLEEYPFLIQTFQNLFEFLICVFIDDISLELSSSSSREIEYSVNQGSIYLLKLQALSFLFGAILLIRADCGWNRNHWMEQSSLTEAAQLIPGTLSHYIVRHLGDACNELGQTYFRCLSSISALALDECKSLTFEELLSSLYKLFSEKVLPVAEISNNCYTSSLEIFSALSPKMTQENIANLIAVRCNMSCLKRLLSSTLCELIIKSIRSADKEYLGELQSLNSPILKSTTSSRGRGHQRHHQLSPLDYIYQAIEICQDSIMDIHSSNSLNSTGAPSILTLELATNYTFSGILYRKCLGDNSISSILNPKIPLYNTDQAIRLINESIIHFEKALSIFSQISNHPSATKNIPVIHYHLGSLRAMLWGYEVRQLSDNYSQQYEINLQHSMVHYSHAHTYYLKYDVGCTLLLILTEMCEMYLHSFQLHEITLNNEIKNIKNIKDQNKNHNLSHSSELITSSLIFIHQLISSLLGGAYRVLIDCRFALTGIVLERYGQVMLENGLIETIIRLLKNLLLKLLKYLSFLLPLYDAKGEESNDDQRTVTSTSTSVTTIQLLKEIYSNLLKTTNWKYQSTQINSCGSSSSGGGGGERSVASSSSAGGGGSSSSGSGDSEKDIKYLYEILEKLNSCEWLKANL